MLTRDSIVQRARDLVSAPMGDEIAMMDLDTGTYFVLDPIAAKIWAEMSTPIALGDLVQRLTSTFDVTPAQCEADVVKFLERLSAKGLVRAVDA